MICKFGRSARKKTQSSSPLGEPLGKCNTFPRPLRPKGLLCAKNSPFFCRKAPVPAGWNLLLSCVVIISMPLPPRQEKFSICFSLKKSKIVKNHKNPPLLSPRPPPAARRALSARFSLPPNAPRSPPLRRPPAAQDPGCVISLRSRITSLRHFSPGGQILSRFFS